MSVFRTHYYLAILTGMLSCVPSAWASGATFAITAKGIDLDKADESQDPPQYRAMLVQGQAMTLIAQALALPRGGKPSPFEPEVGAWLFDDEYFRIMPIEKKQLDKTMIAVRLKTLKLGKTRVRFVGEVLGYYRQYDVLVDIVAPKE